MSSTMLSWDCTMRRRESLLESEILRVRLFECGSRETISSGEIIRYKILVQSKTSRRMESSYRRTTEQQKDIQLWKRRWNREIRELNRYVKRLVSCKAPKINYALLPIFLTMGFILIYLIIDTNKGISIDQKLGESYLREYYLDQVNKEKLIKLEKERNIQMRPGEYLDIIYALPYLTINPVSGSEHLKSLEKIVKYSSVPLRFHFLTDAESLPLVDTIMSRLKSSSKIELKFSMVTLEDFKLKSRHEICPTLSDSKEFCDFLISQLTPLLFPFTFDSLERAIYVDQKLTFMDDIGMLIHTLRDLNSSHQGIAAVHEQSNRYMRSFGTWQRINPSTKLGRPPSEKSRGKPGFNPSLLALHLSKLRSNSEYKSFLNEKQISKLINTYKYHGTVETEQRIDLGDALNLLAVDVEYLFYSLDCAWNRRSETSSDLADKKFNVCKVKSGTRAWNGPPNPNKIRNDKYEENAQSHSSFVVSKKLSLEDV